MTEPASFPATAEPIEHPNLSAEDPIEPTGLTIDLTTNLLTSIQWRIQGESDGGDRPSQDEKNLHGRDRDYVKSPPSEVP